MQRYHRQHVDSILCHKTPGNRKESNANGGAEHGLVCYPLTVHLQARSFAPRLQTGQLTLSQVNDLLKPPSAFFNRVSLYLPGATM